MKMLEILPLSNRIQFISYRPCINMRINDMYTLNFIFNDFQVRMMENSQIIFMI